MRRQARRKSEQQGGRPAVVLLVVIAMLTLFSVIALSFVFYAESEANASQMTSLSWNKNAPDADPELLLSFFLSQLVYDTNNVNSAIRGHSLARTMYGWNPNALNASAYSGVGRLHTASVVPGIADDFYAVNTQFYPNDGIAQRTPEIYGNPGMYRAWNAPYTYPDLNNMFLAQVAADRSGMMQSCPL